MYIVVIGLHFTSGLIESSMVITANCCDYCKATAGAIAEHIFALLLQ